MCVKRHLSILKRRPIRKIISSGGIYIYIYMIYELSNSIYDISSDAFRESHELSNSIYDISHELSNSIYDTSHELSNSIYDISHELSNSIYDISHELSNSILYHIRLHLKKDVQQMHCIMKIYIRIKKERVLSFKERVHRFKDKGEMFTC